MANGSDQVSVGDGVIEKVQSASAGEVADQLGHVCAGGRDVSVLCRGFSGTVSGESRGKRGCTRQAGVASGTRFCTANKGSSVSGPVAGTE